MVGFSDRDIRNEVARIFKSEIDVVRNKGVVDSDSAYNQTMDIAVLTFLTNPDAVFYLTQLTVNELLVVVKKEIELVEDMLFAIDYVSNKPPDYRGANTELNNATTALLALDAADSVRNRPELDRFTKNITKFSERLRRTTARSGSLALSAGEAKWSIREDMAQLETRHADILDRINLLSSLMSSYDELDIPSKAARTMLRNTRLSINRLLSTLEQDSASSIEEKTKSILLRSLASKSSVNYLAEQQPPSLVRYRGPANPVGGGIYYGRVTGEGEPAVVDTSSGPWETPLTELRVKVNGGAEQVFALGDIPGVSLTSRNKENFGIGSDNDRWLYVAVDPDSHEFIVNAVPAFFALNTVSSLRLLKVGQDPFLSIGFKHLGAPLFFAEEFYDSSVTDDKKWNNLFPAIITDLTLLATYPSASWNPTTQEFTVASLTDVRTAPAAATFGGEDIGRYIKDASGNQFEIVGVNGPLTVVLETYGLTPAPVAGELRGQDGPTIGHTDEFDWYPTSQTLTVDFAPDLTSDPTLRSEWAGQNVTIGPSVKRGVVDTGTKTAADVASDLNTNVPSAPASAHLRRHVFAAPAASDASRVQLIPFSKINGRLAVVSDYLSVWTGATRQSASFLNGFVYKTLGFYLGAEDTDEIVQPQELADFLNASLTDAVAEVVDEVLYEGIARTAFGDKQIEDLDADFSALGVVAGYQVEIRDGTFSGFYRVDAVPDATHLTLRVAEFTAYEDVAYRVLTQRVRISTVSRSRGASLEVTTAPATLDMPSAVQYGSTNLFEAVDSRGANLEFKKVKVGDILYLSGVGNLTITEPGDTQLGVDGEIPTGVVEEQFSVMNSAYQAYETLKENLDLYVSSRALLGKHGLSTSLSTLDAAISPVVASGGFAAATNRATRILADLLSLLTSSPRRSSEYSTPIPTASLNLEAILNTFSAAEVPALKALADDMRGRKYERAVDLLLRGDVESFFNADREDSSYSGAMAKATRTALQDLPDVFADEDSVAAEANEPVEDFENPENPDFVFEEDDEWDIEPEEDGDF